MRYFILVTIIITAMASGAWADKNDFKSIPANTYNQYTTTSELNPYSQLESRPNSINRTYGQFGAQNSPTAITNPYSPDNQTRNPALLLPEKTGNYQRYQPQQQVGDKNKAASKTKKQSAEEAYLMNLLQKSGPQKSISLFMPLLILSSLGALAILAIIIGVFKK